MPERFSHPKPRRVAGLATLVVLALLSACAPPAGADGQSGQLVPIQRPDPAPDETAAGFDLDKLIAAAKKEGPISIYDETGKVVKIAEAFTAKYGIKANGVKIETNVLEKVAMESQANNVIGDVVATSEVPAVYAQLLADGILTSWVPGDMRDTLPETATYPFLSSDNQMLWTYNTEVNGANCPIKNIWELTDQKWAGLVAIPDPESRTVFTTAWNQAARNHADAYAKAYKDLYGEDLKTDEPTAVHEWVKRLAKNSPTIFKNDEEVSDAVGAPGQTSPPMGLMWAAKYRNNADKGYSLAACAGINPFLGASTPQTLAYATKTKSPNAAKLYIHFATSQEGMEFIMPDGKFSFSSLVTSSDPQGIAGIRDQIQPFDTVYLTDDYANTTTWQDFWRGNR
nr:ABC transporter substrate-binding protein [Propionicimonas sp.]